MRIPRRYIQNITEFRKRLTLTKKDSITPILTWLVQKRKDCDARSQLTTLQKLTNWSIQPKKIVHKNGPSYFFTVEGVRVQNAHHREVASWEQPIFRQRHGGMLVIFCQNQNGTMRFLLHARFEPGNIDKLQFSPTIQATESNARQHHGGTKPPLMDYLSHTKTRVIYKARHNEEGARFWRKINTNILLELDPQLALPLPNDSYVWLTLPQIKQLMLIDNVINPFVKTILAPI